VVSILAGRNAGGSILGLQSSSASIISVNCLARERGLQVIINLLRASSRVSQCSRGVFQSGKYLRTKCGTPEVEASATFWISSSYGQWKASVFRRDGSAVRGFLVDRLHLQAEELT
jgi:hypothetical protein